MTLVGMVWIVAKVVIFFAITLFLGLIAFPDRCPKELPANPNWYQVLNYKVSRVFACFGARQFLSMLSMAMFAGVVAHKLGFHAAIGAHFAGLFLHADYFINSKKVKNHEGDIVEQEETDQTFKETNHVIEHLAFTISNN